MTPETLQKANDIHTQIRHHLNLIQILQRGDVVMAVDKFADMYHSDSAPLKQIHDILLKATDERLQQLDKQLDAL